MSGFDDVKDRLRWFNVGRTLERLRIAPKSVTAMDLLRLSPKFIEGPLFGDDNGDE